MAPPPTPHGKGDPGDLQKLEVPKPAEARVKMARAWPAGKLKAIKENSQDRLAALYSPKVAADIRHEWSKLALSVADRSEVDKALKEIKEQWLARGVTLTDAQAREKAIEFHRFDRLLADGGLHILEQRGLAGAPVVFDRANTGGWDPDPNKAIDAVVPNKPGVYVFAVTWANLTSDSRDLNTMSVERRSDGSTHVLSGGFSQMPKTDVKDALNVPVLDSNPSREGSRAVLVYPLSPTAVKK